MELAGWRVLPHFYVPRAQGWPVDVGLVAEFSFERTIYEVNTRRVEIRPMLEMSLGKLQIDFNPSFRARAMHGPGTREGWNFKPAAQAGYEAFERSTPSLEYYAGGRGAVILAASQPDPPDPPSRESKLDYRVVWSFGAGSVWRSLVAFCDLVRPELAVASGI
jgi:hypothetical protein